MARQIEVIHRSDQSGYGSKDYILMRSRLVFEVQLIPNHYMGDMSVYNRKPGDRASPHTSVAVGAIHFWQVGFSRERPFDQLSCQAHGEVPTTYSRATNEMMHITQFSAGEKVVVTDSSSLGQTYVLQTEQKSILLTMDVA